MDIEFMFGYEQAVAQIIVFTCGFIVGSKIWGGVKDGLKGINV